MTHMAHDELLADAISHHDGGGVYIKETRIPAGIALVQHRHAFDHLAYLVSGSVELLVDGITTHHEAPFCFNIEAGKHHGVKANVDSVWLCIWRTDVVDHDDARDGVILAPATDMQAMARSML
jgi:quercetin dioxygenase-like cupin family protein